MMVLCCMVKSPVEKRAWLSAGFLWTIDSADIGQKASPDDNFPYSFAITSPWDHRPLVFSLDDAWNPDMLVRSDSMPSRTE